MSEQKAYDYQMHPDAEYLKENVGEALASGLQQVVLSNPLDPVSFLANWLLKYVENKTKESIEEKSKKSEQLILDNISSEKPIEPVIENKELEEEGNIFINQMSSCQDMDTLYNIFLSHLQKRTQANAVYLCSKLTDGFLFIATTPNNSFLISKFLPNGIGILNDLYIKKEEEEKEEQEDEENPIVPSIAEEPFVFINIPNVLLGPYSKRLHFFQAPRLGAFFCLNLPFESVLNSSCLEQGRQYHY